MSEWQQIETAPLGELVDVWGYWVDLDDIRQDSDQRIPDCIVRSRDNRDIEYRGLGSYCLAHCFHATHWMPRPAPPKEGD